MDWLAPLVVIITGLCSAPNNCIKIPEFGVQETPKPAVEQPADGKTYCYETWTPEKGLTKVCEEKK